MAVNLLLHLSKGTHRILLLRRKVRDYLGYSLVADWSDQWWLLQRIGQVY
jgi:hypothetical protein